MIVEKIYLGTLTICRIYKNGIIIWELEENLSLSGISESVSFAKAIINALVSMNMVAEVECKTYGKAVLRKWVLRPAEGKTTIQSHSSAVLSIRSLLASLYAKGEIKSYGNAVLSFFLLHPFEGATESYSYEDATLSLPPSLRTSGIMPVSSYGDLLLRLMPPLPIDGIIGVCAFGRGWLRALEAAVMRDCFSSEWSYHKSIAHTPDAILFYSKNANPKTYTYCFGDAFNAVFWEGAVSSRSHTTAEAYSPRVVPTISLTEIRNFTSASGHAALAIICAGDSEIHSHGTAICKAFPAAPFAVASVNGLEAQGALRVFDVLNIAMCHAAIQGLAKASLGLAESIRITGANMVSNMFANGGFRFLPAARIRGTMDSSVWGSASCLAAPAILVRGGSASQIGGIGRLRPWHLPIRSGNTLLIRQSYEASVVGNTLSIS